MVRKHTNEHFVEHDFALCDMVKRTELGDLNVCSNLVSKIAAYHQHQRELVQCHKKCLPDLQSQDPGGRLNIKMPSYPYRDSYVKDKTVSPTILPLTWESPYLGKTVFILRRGPAVWTYPGGVHRVTGGCHWAGYRPISRLSLSSVAAGFEPLGLPHAGWGAAVLGRAWGKWTWFTDWLRLEE